MKAIYVYSGNCRQGDVGEATPLKDIGDNRLFIGDIVIVSNVDKFGICDNVGLSVVCSDKYTSYNDGTHLVKDGKIDYFIMGIKNVDFMGADSDKWVVKLVKSHKDVISGEKWENFGFNYQ